MASHFIGINLSACHLNTKEDENVTEFVCAMEVSSQNGMVNLAKIFRGTLDQGWFQIPMKYCDAGAGQLYIDDTEGSIAFRSRYKDDLGEHVFFSKAINHQQNVNDWFYVQYKGPESNNRTVVLKKDENNDTYDISFLDEKGNTPTTQTATSVDKAQLQKTYPYLSTNKRVKSGTELYEIYEHYVNQS